MKRIKVFILAIGLLSFAQVTQTDWTSAQRLIWTPGPSYNPDIAVDAADNLHVVWEDSTPGNWEIYYMRSAEGGANWTSAQRLILTSGWSKDPALAIDSSDNIHLVWSDDTPGNAEIYYKKSTDGGATWTSARRLTGTLGGSYAPDIAVDASDNLHIVWQDYTPGNYEIYYKMSPDGGATWSSAQRLTWTPGLSEFPAIAVDSLEQLHVVWDDDTPGNREIYYKKSAAGGGNWTSTQRLILTSGESWNPAIAIDSSDNLHLFWSDYTPGNAEIYYKKSTNGGGLWASAQRLIMTPGGSALPAIAIDSSDGLHLIWSDDTPGVAEIYYKNGPDGAATWTSAQRLIMTSGSSKDPAIAIDSSDNIHLVWSDDTPGNAEIYYKKGKTTKPVVKPGDWTATADFGKFDFIVSSDSQYITKITYSFSNFSCGGVTLNGGLSISASPGWPISNNSFEIQNYLDPALNQLLTVKGTFSNSGVQASGTWEAKFYGSTCSGSWQGSPKS